MQSELNKIIDCEVCGNKSLDEVLDLGLHPMCDDLVMVGDTRVCREYPIEILYCKTCCTAHQKFQVPKRELFPNSYHYRSRFTADVLDGMNALVNSCKERFGDLKSKRVLDIGCNDGSLLDYFKSAGASTFGIEPTGAFQEAATKGHKVYNNFLTPDVARDFIAAHGKPDFITFTNVFAHIENLRELLTSVRSLMSQSTIVIIENHYLGAILKGNQFDTFYHEHPRSYSFTSFAHIGRSLESNLLDVEFSPRYGGNIRVFYSDTLFCNPSVEKFKKIESEEATFFEQFVMLKRNIESWRKHKIKFIDEQFKKFGRLRAKAFPGRAAILVKLLNLSDKQISVVYEKPGSLKVGHYVPGTRIEIHSDEEFFALTNKDAPIINLAWHIPKEIEKYLVAHGQRGPIYNILQEDDFSHKS